jgi:hypothetical protein
VDRTAEGDVYDPEVAQCFLDAYSAGQPAEMITESLTVEGHPVVRILRHLPDGTVEVFEDYTRDPHATPGWYLSRCHAFVVEFYDPNGTPVLIWDGCEGELL